MGEVGVGGGVSLAHYTMFVHDGSNPRMPPADLQSALAPPFGLAGITCYGAVI